MSGTTTDEESASDRPPSGRTATAGVDDRPKHQRAGLDEIRELYAEKVTLMERLNWANRLVTGRYRAELFGKAEGRVLDVACGMGTNRRYLPDSTTYVGVDISPEMLARAADRFEDLERGETLREMDAQSLDFPDDHFDTVISSLSTCTFPDPVAALREMRRVCKPGGQILLLEHGRSDVGLVARFQDWRADAFYEKHACRWNQEPLDVVSRAELPVRNNTTHLLGIITLIEAAPES